MATPVHSSLISNPPTDERSTVLHTWTIQSQWDAPAIVSGQGAWFVDDDENRYLDLSSMAECCNLGHQHPKIVAAIKAQADQMCYVQPGWGSPPRAELARRVIEKSGLAHGKVFFTLAGADANENAVKFARWFTGRSKIITRYRSYHGATHAALDLSGDNRSWHTQTGFDGIVHALPPYCYRCPFGLKYDSCGIHCADHIADLIEYAGPENVAAVMIEPHAGTNGIVAPPEYWPRVREICNRYGVMLIADEVMSGFGRVGEWFAWQRYGLENAPDMMTLAKGITSAHVPLGAVVVNQKIAHYFENHLLESGLTYSGHPIACAAGIAAIDAYESENLIQRARDLGEWLMRQLNEMKSRLPIIGDVRGQGLFAIVEL
ncbi:MAG TPA: aminotransferase class III-fold pyridoxal phosphate-dependent enzyme, partial [Anaerolineae bacterium]|nr:aminotransferase class III-fold pyridoxal phosphate-dependent enzyme [Anaerolineae bacterium]